MKYARKMHTHSASNFVNDIAAEKDCSDLMLIGKNDNIYIIHRLIKVSRTGLWNLELTNYV